MSAKTSLPKATGSQNAETNASQFPNIKGALEALELLESKIADIRNDFLTSKHNTEERVDGWQETENFGDFADAMLSDDKEFLRKLVNLGLCL